MIRKGGHGSLCFVRPDQRFIAGRRKRAVFLEELKGLFQIAFVLIALFNHAGPELALFFRCLSNGFDHGKREFAFLEIISDILARRGSIPLIIQKIIGDLEGDAEGVAIVEQSLHLFFGRPCDHTAHFGCRREKRGRFTAHDLQIDRFGRREILRGGQLQDFAFGNRGRSIGENIENAQRSGFDHELEAAGKEVIANENR